MSDLQRYGLEWKSSTDFICHPMDDGYWTPWHIANNEIDALRQKLDQKQADLDRALARVAAKEQAEAQEDALWETLIKIADFLNIDTDKARKIPGKPSSVYQAAIIRKQAEAVEAFLSDLREKQAAQESDYGVTVTRSLVGQGQLEQYAARLRQQADQLEGK